MPLMTREVYITLPEEAQIGDTEPMVGRLRKAMYGTRDAPQNWQTHVTAILKQMGFTAGKANPCIFQHGGRDLQVSVHVDDFLCAGVREDLDWFRQQLGKHFDSTSSILGPGSGEEKSIKYLNRIIEWTTSGLTYQHDPKHVTTILNELGMKDCSGVNTPGTKEAAQEDDDVPLAVKESTEMRRIIATVNYIAQDRLDIGYAVKECARMMATPTQRTIRSVKRLARYLKDHPKCVMQYPWQKEPQGFSAYSDADWAGCVRTRRSTSGGVILRGKHIIKHWSRTQATIAVSSGESELYALVRVCTEGLGLRSLALEMGMKQDIHIFTDSTAAKGTVNRVGSGRLKHISTNHFWVQEKTQSGDVQVHKVPRAGNFADLLTHHWDPKAGWQMLRSMSLQC